MLKQDITDIPNYGRILDASNSFIVDQGFAVFAVVIFALVIFGMMILMFMMLRQMGKESKQQDEILSIMKATIAKQAQSDQRIGDNTAATTKQTESINTMNRKLEELEKAIREMLQRVNEGQANFETFKRLNEKLSQDMVLALECLEKLVQQQETPVIPPETPKEETPKLAVPPSRADEQEKTE